MWENHMTIRLFYLKQRIKRKLLRVQIKNAWPTRYVIFLEWQWAQIAGTKWDKLIYCGINLKENLISLWKNVKLYAKQHSKIKMW